MNVTDELRKLADLRREGALTEPEFVEAKRRLLSSGGVPDPGATVSTGKTAPDGAARIAAKTYRSSRWSSGNLFFPDRLTLASDGILFRKGALFGSSEEHISYGAVASFRTKNGIFLASVSIETSGGSQPIFVNGLWKSDAKKILDTLRIFQDRA